MERIGQDLPAVVGEARSKTRAGACSSAAALGPEDEKQKSSSRFADVYWKRSRETTSQ